MTDASLDKVVTVALKLEKKYSIWVLNDTTLPTLPEFSTMRIDK